MKKTLIRIKMIVVLVVAVGAMCLPLVASAASYCSSHTYSWRTYEHWNNSHTYERYCTRCGYVTQAFTLPCQNGNRCAEFNSPGID